MFPCQNIRTARRADGVHTETILENHTTICDAIEVRGLINPTAVAADSV